MTVKLLHFPFCDRVLRATKLLLQKFLMSDSPGEKSRGGGFQSQLGQAENSELDTVALELGSALIGSLDLRVPGLRISPKYHTSRSSTGKTKVHWENGFYGNIHFIPWDNFDGKVEETLKKIHDLDFMKLTVANMQVTLLRLFVSGKFYVKSGKEGEVIPVPSASSDMGGDGDYIYSCAGTELTTQRTKFIEALRKYFPNAESGAGQDENVHVSEKRVSEPSEGE